MTVNHRLPAIVIACVTLVGAASFWIWADEAPKPAAPAATQSSVKISDDAKPLIDQVAGAYAKLKSLDLTGTITSEVQVEGADPSRHSADFTSSFVAPTRFRHEISGDVLVGSTGKQLYIYLSDENAYSMVDAPKDKVEASELPRETVNVLELQNPSLLLALSKTPAAAITDGASEASKAPDVKLADSDCPTLSLAENDKTTVKMSFDPQTHLLRQAQFDITASLKQRRPDLSSAVITVSYSKITPDAGAKDELFAWSPPPGATNAAAAAAAHPLESVPATALEGKPAPDFKIDALQGDPISLAALKGHVVVLDFWATWCGPCKMSLPHLDKLYQAKKADGLQVFAVDQREDKGDVQDFVKETKLSVPVLLDGDGRVGGQYAVEGIPQTVVIGKDGKVKKVFVGFNPDESPAELQKIVEAAMHE